MTRRSSSPKPTFRALLSKQHSRPEWWGETRGGPLRALKTARQVIVQQERLCIQLILTGENVFSAQICLAVYPAAAMSGLECGHRFCHNCWGEYLTTKVMSEGIGQTITCAAHLCDVLIDDVTVMRLIPDPKVRLKYQHLITNSFVEVFDQSKFIRCGNWCLFLSFLLFVRFKSSAIACWDGVRVQIAAASFGSNMWNLVRWRVVAGPSFVSRAAIVGTSQSAALYCVNGPKSVMTTRKRPIGSQPTQR